MKVVSFDTKEYGRGTALVQKWAGDHLVWQEGPMSASRATDLAKSMNKQQGTPMTKQKPSKEAVRTVICPVCYARPGEPCFTASGQDRKANHTERRDRFIATRVMGA